MDYFDKKISREIVLSHYERIEAFFVFGYTIQYSYINMGELAV